jgi:hypothetical protein
MVHEDMRGVESPLPTRFRAVYVSPICARLIAGMSPTFQAVVAALVLAASFGGPG